VKLKGKLSGLSNQTKAILMLITVLLPPLISWFASAMPTDRAAIGSLCAALLSAILIYIEKLLMEEAG